MSLLIEFLTYKLAASLSKSTKVDQNQSIKSSEKFYNGKHEITDISDAYLLLLLIINTFNRSIKSTLIEIFFILCE